MTRRPPLFVFLFAVLLLTGCDALEGPQGPQGPPGAANIKTVVLSFSSGDLTHDGRHATVSWQVQEITAEVYDRGSVHAYMKFSGAWLTLPYTWINGGDSVEITYAYEKGRFVLIFEKNSETVQQTLPTGDVKVVVVPPAKAKSSTSKHKLKNTVAL